MERRKYKMPGKAGYVSDVNMSWLEDRFSQVGAKQTFTMTILIIFCALAVICGIPAFIMSIIVWFQSNPIGVVGVNGMIGINKTHPQFTLDVGGDIRASNTIYSSDMNVSDVMNANAIVVDNLEVVSAFKLDTATLNISNLDFIGSTVFSSLITFSGGVHITTLTGNQIVATTNNSHLTTMAYGSSATASTIVTRDTNADSSFHKITATSSLVISGVSNQMTVGSYTMNFTTPTASRLITMPDPGANATFLLSESTNRVINGPTVFKGLVTFTTSVAFNGSIDYNGAISYDGDIHFHSTTETDGVATFQANGAYQIAIRNGTSSNHIYIAAPSTPIIDMTFTLPDVESDAYFVVNQGAQTLYGPMTFANSLILSATSNQLTFRPNATGFGITLTAVRPATGSLVYTIPDAGSYAYFIMSASNGTQTINSSLTIGNTLTVTGSSPEIDMINSGGSGYKIRFSTSFQPDSLYKLNIKNPGSDADFLLTNGTAEFYGTINMHTNASIYLPWVSFTPPALIFTDSNSNQIRIQSSSNMTARNISADKIVAADTANTFTAAQTFGTVTIGSGTISFPTTGGTATALDYNEVYNSTWTFYNSANSANQNTSRVIINRLGVLVTMSIDPVIITLTTAGTITTDAVLNGNLARFFPADDGSTGSGISMTQQIWVQSNSTKQFGLFTKATDTAGGRITIYSNALSANFAAGSGAIPVRQYLSWLI